MTALRRRCASRVGGCIFDVPRHDAMYTTGLPCDAGSKERVEVRSSDSRVRSEEELCTEIGTEA